MPSPPDRLVEALADRYRFEGELGQGGMATVYRAEDLKHSRQVAIKVLKPDLAAVLGTERFLSEIKITAGLDHPHILTLIDSGSAAGFLYYVLPLVRGESLRDRLDRQKQLGLDEALAITKQVAGALDYAHRHKVIHRDIKPENILLQEGEAMLTDFGIALAVQEAGGARLTETGMAVGTPYYMSPEQSMAERDLDGRTDIYALGCVLYEMLAGEPPIHRAYGAGHHRQADQPPGPVGAHPAGDGAGVGGSRPDVSTGQVAGRPVCHGGGVCGSAGGAGRQWRSGAEVASFTAPPPRRPSAPPPRGPRHHARHRRRLVRSTRAPPGGRTLPVTCRRAPLRAEYTR